MNRIAYLVASFDVSGNEPVYQGSDIFSEPNPTTRGRTLQVVLYSVEDENFGEAREKLIKQMLRADVSGPRGYFRWLRPQIQAIVRRERAYRKRLRSQGFVAKQGVLVKTPKRVRKG